MIRGEDHSTKWLQNWPLSYACLQFPEIPNKILFPIANCACVIRKVPVKKRYSQQVKEHFCARSRGQHYGGREGSCRSADLAAARYLSGRSADRAVTANWREMFKYCNHVFTISSLDGRLTLSWITATRDESGATRQGKIIKSL